MRWYKISQSVADERAFAPGEDPGKFGTPAVDILGEHELIMEIPGVQGSINLQVSVDLVKKALEQAFGSDYFAPITTIKIVDLPGNFGEAHSTEPHTIYLNEDAMVGALQEAVVNEIQQHAQTGQEIEFNEDIGRKINEEVAKLLWETIPHERQHAVDFQESLQRLLETSHNGPEAVTESPGEQAGKSALSRFTWYQP